VTRTGGEAGTSASSHRPEIITRLLEVNANANAFRQSTLNTLASEKEKRSKIAEDRKKMMKTTAVVESLAAEAKSQQDAFKVRLKRKVEVSLL
jgi:hypothetical protein